MMDSYRKASTPAEMNWRHPVRDAGDSMGAGRYIAFALLAILGANLSRSTVTRMDLEKKTVPFQIAVLPDAVDGLVIFKVEYDDRNFGRARQNREDGFLPRLHVRLPKAALSAQLPMHSKDGNLIGTVAFTPELAFGGSFVVFVGRGNNDHAYTIPLDLFADEIKIVRKVTGQEVSTSVRTVTTEELTKFEVPFSIQMPKHLNRPDSFAVTYDRDGMHPNGIFKHIPRKDRVVQMTLEVNHPQSKLRTAVIPIKTWESMLDTNELTEEIEAVKLVGEFDLVPEFARTSRVLIKMKDSDAKVHTFAIPLRPFVDEVVKPGN